jgi:hypothetical protein
MGNCWDNAVDESFLKTIKVDWIYRQTFTNQDQAQLLIFKWSEAEFEEVSLRKIMINLKTKYSLNNCLHDLGKSRQGLTSQLKALPASVPCGMIRKNPHSKLLSLY